MGKIVDLEGRPKNSIIENANKLGRWENGSIAYEMD